MTERIDQGDLDAAMERIDLVAFDDGIFDAICDCLASVVENGSNVNLLKLVNKVVEHQKECPEVGRRREYVV